MQRLARIFAAALFALVTGTALAAYPERPITLIVPWGAGGGTDAVARFFAAYLEKDLGQPVNVVNRTSPVGELSDGAVTFRPLPDAAGGEGTSGESGFDSEQPIANATSEMLKTAYKNLCCMNCS